MVLFIKRWQVVTRALVTGPGRKIIFLNDQEKEFPLSVFP